MPLFGVCMYMYPWHHSQFIHYIYLSSYLPDIERLNFHSCRCLLCFTYWKWNYVNENSYWYSEITIHQSLVIFGKAKFKPCSLELLWVVSRWRFMNFRLCENVEQHAYIMPYVMNFSMWMELWRCMIYLGFYCFLAA